MKDKLKDKIVKPIKDFPKIEDINKENKSESKKRPLTAKGIKTKNFILKTRNENKKEKDIIHYSARNANDYLHVMNNNPGVTYGEMAWGLGLREYRTEGNENNKKELNGSAPKFYEQDLSKFMKRHKSEKRPMSANPNYNYTKHLIDNKGKIETQTGNQLSFLNCLRQYKPTEGCYINPNKWKELPYKLIEFDYPVFPKDKNVQTEIDIQHYEKKGAKLIRPFKKIFDEVTVGKDTVKRKKYVPNKDIIYGVLGEHNSLYPYNSTYQDVNSFKNNEILKKHTNQQCLFELCLRTKGNILRTRTKRKRKDELERAKEEIIKAKTLDFRKMAKLYK